MKLDRQTAETWARWFRCLGDPSRLTLLHLLADARRPMTVGEIVERVAIGQSTVSHHLRLLAEVGFVLVDRRGTESHYRINDLCLECFPSAADVVMGNLPRSANGPPTPPWLEEAAG